MQSKVIPLSSVLLQSCWVCGAEGPGGFPALPVSRLGGGCLGWVNAAAQEGWEQHSRACAAVGVASFLCPSGVQGGKLWAHVWMFLD